MTDDMHRGGGESAGTANPGFDPLGASGLDASSVNSNSRGTFPEQEEPSNIVS